VSEIAIHTSPGTSAMAAVWILLAKTKYAGATLFKSWIDKGGNPHLAEVEIPFDLTLDVLPEIAARRGALLEPAEPQLPATNAFDALIHRSAAMAAVIRDARRAALYPNPVLILGESGTGKELLARAMHAASLRAGKPWSAMNCAAIPRDLLDSELFGHAKGAFTGAVTDRPGRFEACDGGTLFLDEVGDMPPETQVRLLRVLQEGEIQRVGESKTRTVDVRVIAATNRDLVAAVREGRFRDDLFYRLAVLVLRLPPLRERHEDIFPLAQHFLSNSAARRPAVSTRADSDLPQAPGGLRGVEGEADLLPRKRALQVWAPVLAAQPSHPRAKAIARHTSCIRLSLRCATRRPTCPWATVTRLWRFTAHSCFIPSSVPSGTSDGTPRTVEVIGATVTGDRYRIADPRVRIRTGRSLSGGANRYRRTSPRSSRWAMPPPPPNRRDHQYLDGACTPSDRSARSRSYQAV